MKHLIDKESQQEIAERIDRAVEEVLLKIPNHGSEEGITPVLGHALMQQSFQTQDLSVIFNYRQLSKNTEEPYAGADGGFLVKVENLKTTIKKGALFQAKLLKGRRAIRELSMSAKDAQRLMDQATDMLGQTEEAVAIFYTHANIYVVDAEHYRSAQLSAVQSPLSEEHRLVTLGTYLGRWLPRCTRGDTDPSFISRVEHQDGFKHGLTMDVITRRPSISWEDNLAAKHWRVHRPQGRR